MALINQSITGRASLVHIISTVVCTSCVHRKGTALVAVGCTPLFLVNTFWILLVCGLDTHYCEIRIYVYLKQVAPAFNMCVLILFGVILYLETTPNIIIYQSQCQKSPVLDPFNAGLKFLSILQSNHAKSQYVWCILMQHKIIQFHQFPFWPLNSVEYIIFIHVPENFPILSLKLGLNIPILLG